MRKLYSVLLSVVLILQMCAITGFAASSTVTVADVKGNKGETVSVTVDLADCAGFINMGLEFGYDSTVLTLESVTNAVSGALFNKSPNLEKNPYNMTWNATENVVHSGTLVTLQFKIADDAKDGIYPVTVDFYKGPIGTSKDGITVNYDENLKSIGLNYVSGSVAVGDVSPNEPQGAYVKVNTVRSKAGEAVDVVVDLTNCGGFINLGLEFGYDANVLTLESVKNSVSDALFNTSPELTRNPFCMTWNATENIVHSGTLVTLRFKVAEGANAGTYPVTVDYYKGPIGTSKDGITVNYDENLKSIGLSYVSGAVIVKPQDYTLTVEKTDAEGFCIVITAEAPDEMNGIFVAAVYEDKKLLEAQILDADYSTDVTFVSSGDTVKVMWLESITSLKPLCNSVQF